MTITMTPFPEGGVTDVFADGRLIGWFDTTPKRGEHYVRDWDGEHIGSASDPMSAVDLLMKRDAA